MALKCFPFVCYKILPLVYTPGLSDYEVLCKCIDYINELISSDKELARQLTAQGASIDVLKTEMEAVQEELKKIQNGTYLNLYLDQMLTLVQTWVDDNLPGIVGSVVKFVQFGLTPTGRFCARIPENWDFLKFGTIMDPTSELYGHLFITY